MHSQPASQAYAAAETAANGRDLHEMVRALVALQAIEKGALCVDQAGDDLIRAMGRLVTAS